MIEAVDLFCGAGGLTAGLRRAGIIVRAGYDIDENCRYAYEINNGSSFITKDVEQVTSEEINEWYKKSKYRLLAGCAPCQPFSTYNQGKDTKADRKWPLLYHFRRLINEIQPELVTMENVPDVVKHQVYEDFYNSLAENYFVWAGTVDCSEYGLPQNRHRHVLLASKLGPIELIKPTHKNRKATVKSAIGGLPKIEAGECDLNDPMHRSAGLSEINLRRIKASKQGGTWADWPEELIAECHKKPSGKTFPSVYGRMSWNEPGPTMTTLCYGFGNGRFGHPEQNRGISLREAAILQSFPKTYEFMEKEKINFRAVGRMIGNAVPVRLGEVIGTSIFNHAFFYSQANK